MICLREQYERDSDQVDIERQVRVNLEFDFKRRLTDVRDVDGILAAETPPWRTLEEFLAAREQFAVAPQPPARAQDGRRPRRLYQVGGDAVGEAPGRQPG